MNEDLLIKRYQQRPGYRLADVAEVGLPVYSLNLQVLTLVHKRMPAIEEFLLRCLAMDISGVDEISQYLGLYRDLLKPAFANLAQTENIALTAERGIQSWKLTQKGRATLENNELISPEERTFPIHFDAICRKPTLYRFQRPLSYRGLKDQGLLEIEIYPQKRPQATEISPGDIERLIKNLQSLTEQRRDVLAIRSLENIKKGFIRAVALFFKGSRENEVQLGFLIDGRLSSEHELAFAQTEGFKRLVQKITADSTDTPENQLPKEVVQRASDELSKSIVDAELQVAESSESLRLVRDEDEKEVLIRRLQEAEDALRDVQAKAKKVPIRNIYVLDHPPLLQEAIGTAQRRLLIISPWITGKVVNRDFLMRLEQLLQKDVEVYIGYGISENETEDLHPNDRRARDSLHQLALKYRNFSLLRLGNTHAKILIKDSDYAAITSFNWLSFKGDPARSFRDEQGVLLQDPELVEQKFNELIGRFTAAFAASD